MDLTIKDLSATESRTDLHIAAQQLVDAAFAYWEAYRKETGGASIVWIEDTAGRLVIVTRGEYHQALLDNIKKLQHKAHVTVYEIPNQANLNLSCVSL